MAQAAGRKVAIIGTGDVGLGLARGFTKLGDSVVVGSRAAVAKGTATDDKTAKGKKGLIEEYGLLTFEDACKAGDIIVLAVKFSPIRDILAKIKPHCDGKIIIDAVNPIKWVGGDPGQNPIAVDRDVLKEYGSAGELIQGILDKSKVVKAWNIVGNAYMTDANPNGVFAHDPLMVICGDDADAKKLVNGILGQFGWKDIMDMGGINQSAHLESMCFIWCARGFMLETWNHQWAHMVPPKK